jgi:hypothetical protein
LNDTSLSSDIGISFPFSFSVRVVRSGAPVGSKEFLDSIGASVFPSSSSSSVKVATSAPKRKSREEESSPLEARQKRQRLDGNLVSLDFSGLGISGKDLGKTAAKGIHGFIVPVTVSFIYEGKLKEVSLQALADTGADVSIFDVKFVEEKLLPWRRREQRRNIQAVDGSVCPGSGWVQVTQLKIKVPDGTTGRFETRDLETEVMKFGLGQRKEYDLILGMDWFKPNGISLDTGNCCLRFPPKVELVEIHDHDDWELALTGAVTIGMIRYVDDGHATIGNNRLGENQGDLQMTDAEPLWRDTMGRDVAERLPVQYRDFAELFSREAQDVLPEHGPHDMHIELEPGKEPPVGKLYPMSKDELDILKEYLDEMERTGKIRPTTSSCGAPIFFVKQGSGKLRLVVDFRGLNAITKKDKYPIPLMATLAEQVADCRYFSKFDLKNGFNLIRIQAGDEWKTAFRTRYGAYEYLVMPFGLTNAPSVFQRFMNGVLHERLDRGVNVYIDDILTSSKTEEEHVETNRWVLQQLKKNKLCVNVEKSVFHQDEVTFCGYKVGSRGVSMGQDRIEHIVNWKSPRSVHEVQQFLGFANFYRKFIRGYSKICRPISDLLKKGILFSWTPECEQAFNDLKKAFTEAPILGHFYPDRPKMIETDASDLAKGAVLS